MLLQQLKRPTVAPSNTPQFEPRTTISTDHHIRGWRKAKEKTAAGPSKLHFGMYKAHIQRRRLAEVDAFMRSIAYSTGYSYSRWKRGLDFHLLKRKREFWAKKLRTIGLLEADFNMNNKVLGADAMRAGERAKVLTPHNYGGRKNLRAVEVNMNQYLTYNSIWGRRGRAVVMSNDAKGCYD
ncbi:hypothetical protein SEMRO_2534_G330480.1 [Seminavis robusta]|uniref:Uncharacterized protein n=1 Tax=Seminavis robusta TaxID=568900 RepID=A0A9N8EZ76_9STRA|nr:hypothetical protein SEMRO_2534_G330480.1 [Seminavis robusta]|eukprot:Sro2534_g330480.1 n/a (181) ;mRNA; r:4360-4902